MREYTRGEVFRANLPYGVMVVLGACVIAACVGSSAAGVAWAGLYVLYGIAGALWVMRFICPFCAYYNSRGCPCGYGLVSARIAQKGEKTCFSEKFKRHIPVIVPLWIIPVLCGGYALLRGFSLPLLVLLVLFVADAFVILPLLSRKHSCAECPQRDDCPWMGQRGGR